MSSTTITTMFGRLACASIEESATHKTRENTQMVSKSNRFIDTSGSRGGLPLVSQHIAESLAGGPEFTPRILAQAAEPVANITDIPLVALFDPVELFPPHRHRNRAVRTGARREGGNCNRRSIVPARDDPHVAACDKDAHSKSVKFELVNPAISGRWTVDGRRSTRRALWAVLRSLH